MPVDPRAAALDAEMTAWRRDLHAHPELAFEETRTAALVAEKLRAWGIEVATGVAGTGVVGTLSTGDGPVIGLRADMDALPMDEAAEPPHRSVHPGRMHACGHDGHTAMLLGAAKILAETRNFRGTVRFVFQPAEELKGGARVMVEEGLFDRFPIDRVFGLHNWPGLPEGMFGVRAGPLMAACDTFEITVRGRGGHGAMPHRARDPIPAAAEMIGAVQTLAARWTDPAAPVVVSVTAVNAGDSFNVIPDTAVLRGTARAFDESVRESVEAGLERIAVNIARAHGVEGACVYHRGYPPTVNDAAATETARMAAEAVAGPGRVTADLAPSTGAEDFAYLLQRRPGCYVWLGAGDGQGHLHGSGFDFNDSLLPIGAGYWVALAESALA